ARGRWGNLAQLGVDARAVVALVVVLHDGLPVGGDLVGVVRAGPQRLGTVRGEQVFEGAEVGGQRRCGTGGVDEQPAVPVGDGYLDEAVRGGVEGGDRAHGGRGGERTVEAVGPAVVRADDAAPGG